MTEFSCAMDLIRKIVPGPAAGGTGRGPTVLTGIYYHLMDDCVDGFLKNGCEVLYPGLRRSADDPGILFSEPALNRTIEDGRYDLFFCINGDGLDDAGDRVRAMLKLGKKIAVWYVDDPFNPFAPWNADRRFGEEILRDERIHFFTIDGRFALELQSRGCANVSVLPHAVNPEWADRRTELINPPAGPITFVGHLDLENLDRFESYLAEYPPPAGRLVRDYLEARTANYCLSWEDFSSESGEAAAEFRGDRHLSHIARRLATIRCKIHAIELIESAGVNVYGFEDWKRVLKNPAAYKGHVPYYGGLSDVYRRSFATLNLSHAQLSDGCNQRVLDVPACGGRLITDSRPAIRDLLPGHRIAMYTTPNELVRRIHEMIQSPGRRGEGPDAIQKTIRENHTYERRMKTLLSAVC